MFTSSYNLLHKGVISKTAQSNDFGKDTVWTVNDVLGNEYLFVKYITSHRFGQYILFYSTK